MKKIKMILGLMMAMVLVMGLMTACGGKDENKSDKKDPTPTVAETKTEAPETEAKTEAKTETTSETEEKSETEAVTEDVTETAETEATTATEEATGSKKITIVVKDKDGQETEYAVVTDAEFLRGAMDDAESAGFIYSGTESDYGIMIETINGMDAIYAVDSSYWAIYVNGEYGMFGADSQPVKDGDTFKFEYTK